MWAWIAVPMGTALLHSLLFRTWIVDDAAISFAFAKNLAEGHGLTCQPGSPPVEGYSNPLWVLLFTPLMSLHLFDILITPKVLSALMVAATFIIVGRTLVSCLRCEWGAAFVALLLTALNPSFIIWTHSGLENPLYVLFLSLTMGLAVVAVRSKLRDWRIALALGGLAAGAALTRPDGVIFVAAYPLALTLVQLKGGQRCSLRSLTIHLLVYGVAFALILSAYLVFRLLYFGDWLPNAYYAKGGPSLRDVAALVVLRPRMASQIQTLMTSVAGPFGNLVWVGLLVLTVHLASTRRFGRGHVVLGTYLLLAACDYLLLPDDWMPEFRFATPFILFFFCYAVALVDAFLGRWQWGKVSPGLVRVFLAMLVVGVSIPLYLPRSLAFARDPAVSFREVAERVGHRFNRYAEALGVKEGSLLTPDTGGALWYSELRVYDLGMLCDRNIARTLRKNQEAFYNYVFEEIRPTFIYVHGGWSFLAALEDDPRFRREYVAIGEEQVVWASGTPGLAYAGDYVRRDVVQGKEEVFQWLQAQYEP